ncbi:MAG: 50S ribosomal protein L25/general stress protein Ctc [Gemmatimonadota bacterium]|nr:50S ribosomal protein L25/general stress protein Ctc [Gemmatimonadota bacterium]
MSLDSVLKAELRTSAGKGSARKLRSAGQIPAVVYGDGQESVPVTLDAHDTSVLFHRISVDNTIVSLEIDGDDGGIDTLVREVQVHPFKPIILHVDFLRLRKGVAVDVDVPVHLEGTSEGVRVGGGIMEQVIHTLAVRCIPSNIPESIVIDVTSLEVGDSVHVSDLKEREGVEYLTDPVQTICAVVLPKAVEEPEEEELLEGEELAEGAEPVEGEAAAASDEGTEG